MAKDSKLDIRSLPFSATNCLQLNMTASFEEADKFQNLADITEKKFDKFRKTAKTLFWSIFDPGHPEFVDCQQGPGT